MDSDGYGAHGNVDEINIYGFIDRKGRVVLKFQAIEDFNELEMLQKEAEKRGLDVENSCPIIFDRYLDEDSVKMFESMKVMTAKELAARNEIKWETYTKKIQIESRIFGDMALNQIIPVATKYQSSLIDNVCKLKTIFPAEKAEKVGANNLTLIERISEHSAYITDNVAKMIEERKKANRLECEREKAIAYHDNVAPMIEDIRKHIDELFADDVLVSADDLSEIAVTNVDKAAIAVDLTTTTNLTDFKTDTESLTTIIQTDKNKK